MSKHGAARKSIVHHCTTFMILIVVSVVLAKFRESFPFNYLILCIWLLALIVSVPPACFLIIFRQDRSDQDTEKLFLSTINDFSSKESLAEFSKLCWPNSSSIHAGLMSHKKLFVKAGFLASILSLSMVIMEFKFKISTAPVGSHLASLRMALSCWWSYTMLSDLKFGGYAVTESQHR